MTDDKKAMADKSTIIVCHRIEDDYKDMVEEDIKSMSVVHNEDDESKSISREEFRGLVDKLVPEDKPMTLKDWIETETGQEWQEFIAHTVIEELLHMEMLDICDNHDYFEFYLWSQDSVYLPYRDEEAKCGWTLAAVPRNPPQIA